MVADTDVIDLSGEFNLRSWRDLTQDIIRRIRRLAHDRERGGTIMPGEVLI